MRPLRSTRSVFGPHAGELAVSSTKSMTGHLLGAAGGVEAVFTALALRDQFALPPSTSAQRTRTGDLDYVPNTGREMKMEYALSQQPGLWADTMPAWLCADGRADP